MKQLQQVKCLTSTHLKLIAMFFMLLDHMWGTVIPGAVWMTCLGRIAFPIFAFQIAEGYANTHNFKKYLLRMFLFALISEIPYNLMMEGRWFNPFGQNVMFTFCLALLLIRWMDKARAKGPVRGVIVALLCLLIGYLGGTITFVDYHGAGVLMVLVFWLFRDIRFGWLVQLAAMIYINFEIMGGMGFEWSIFGADIFFPKQGFALLAMIPIWLYNGEQGKAGKAFRYACYAFYPVHITILALIALCLL